jgi:hypothetical protein
MRQIVGVGAFTDDIRAAIEENFNQVTDVVRQRYYVNNSTGSNSNDGLSPSSPLASITHALALAKSNDQIFLAPGSYDEAVVITGADAEGNARSNLMIVGQGGPGAAAIAPSASNAVAITVSGTAARRNSGVTLVNVGGEGNGTGGGLYVFGNIRRFRAFGCKFEGGAFAAKLESTAAGSVGDTKFVENEFAWTTTALSIVVSGGGDPVTQTLVQRNLFHNFVTDGIVNSGAHSTDLWVIENVFANQEDATEPTQYLDIDEANTTGLVAKNVFATTVMAAAKLAIAAGVIWAGNQVLAEGAATGGGTAGRPV